MKKLFVLLAMMFPLVCLTATTEVSDQGSYVRYTGTSAADNEIVIQTNDMHRWDACLLISVTGSVDVYTSLNGTNYSTAAYSLQDFGATSTDPVLSTAAGRNYGFVFKGRTVRVLQNGATAVTAILTCWAQGK